MRQNAEFLNRLVLRFVVPAQDVGQNRKIQRKHQSGSVSDFARLLALDPTFTIRRFREGAATDNPTYLAQRERVYDGMRKAGLPEE